jgi:hypothetical protein
MTRTPHNKPPAQTEDAATAAVLGEHAAASQPGDFQKSAAEGQGHRRI